MISIQFVRDWEGSFLNLVVELMAFKVSIYSGVLKFKEYLNVSTLIVFFSSKNYIKNSTEVLPSKIIKILNQNFLIWIQTLQTSMLFKLYSMNFFLQKNLFKVFTKAQNLFKVSCVNFQTKISINFFTFWIQWQKRILFYFIKFS